MTTNPVTVDMNVLNVPLRVDGVPTPPAPENTLGTIAWLNLFLPKDPA